METTKRVLLGMSGGIDSTVSAMLLLDKGFEVVGVTLRLWSTTDGFNSTQEPVYATEAKELAAKLGIDHFVVDARQDFYQKVITYFRDEYLCGKTPNPCAKCNVVLKWELLNRLAIEKQCSFIATGHYVNKIVEDDRIYITKGIDPDKEQSFFLWGLPLEILTKAIFPLGQLTKKSVREIAIDRGFKVLDDKKESTGVCFIPQGNYHPLLIDLMQKEGKAAIPGDFVDLTGAKVGTHKGYPFYTVGQRRGLGLSPNEPWYVTKIDPRLNQVVLGKRSDLYQNQMLVENYHLLYADDFEQDVITRIRYRKQSASSKVTIIDKNRLLVTFMEPEWSIAPGQTATFYLGDKLLGGGYILGSTAAM
ncbi:MAG: tRNA 2-thiouridine(34) synthase MnmA [Salinivirgaceae bacterium]